MLRSIYTMMQCSITFNPQLYFDPQAHALRTTRMFDNDHTQQKSDALDRAAKFFEVLFKSPHLLFGIALWAYGAYWLLAVSGLA